MKSKNISISDKINNLTESLIFLEDEYYRYKNSKDDKILKFSIIGQLRSLICIGGSQMNPLLLNISKDIGIPLFIYVLPYKHDPGIVVCLRRSWTTREKIGYNKILFNDRLKEAFYGSYSEAKTYRSRNDIIRRIAENQGASHFGEKNQGLINDLESVKWSYLGEQDNEMTNQKTNFIIDITESVLRLGNRLLLQYEQKQNNINDIDKKIFELDLIYNNKEPQNEIYSITFKPL